MVIIIYVSYMFDKLLVGVKSNHAFMKQDFQHCTILSCCHVPLVMHAYRCEMSGGYHAKDLSMRICWRRGLGR
jgi:hypothetical protein